MFNEEKQSNEDQNGQEKLVNGRERCLEGSRIVARMCLPPIRPSCRPKNENRDAARTWRRKKLLAGSKHTSGKVSPGKDKHESRKIEEKHMLKKEPIPMRKRALPESFWHQPDTMKTSSLAGNFYSVLPPLFSSESNNNEDITLIRPVTPPGEESYEKRLATSRYMTAPPDTVLLFSLFDQFENKIDKSRLVRRGRPKKPVTEKPIQSSLSKHEDDPCMVDSLAEKLFPLLSLGGESPKSIAPKFVVLQLPTGERTVEVAAIQAPKNYSTMLNELVSHM